MAKGNLFILLEQASGYVLFEKTAGDEIGAGTTEMQAAAQEFGRFSKMVSMRALVPFKSAEEALENINCISEGAS